MRDAVVIGEVLVRIAAEVAGILFGKAVDAVVPSSDDVSPRPRGISSTPARLEERRHSYRRWAEMHGFVQDGAREDVFRGERGGRCIRFHTNLEGSHVRPPELEIDYDGFPDASPAIVLTTSSPMPPGHDIPSAIVAVLERDDVAQIDLTRRLVRLSFEPLSGPASFDPALDELLHALTPEPAAPYR